MLGWILIVTSNQSTSHICFWLMHFTYAPRSALRATLDSSPQPAPTKTRILSHENEAHAILLVSVYQSYQRFVTKV